jgi:hypothetical protein
MDIAITQTHIILTANFEELRRLESQALAVYATPAPADFTYAVQLYIGRRPQGQEDCLFAMVEDFLDAAGMRWAERREGDQLPPATATWTCTLPRTACEDASPLARNSHRGMPSLPLGACASLAGHTTQEEHRLHPPAPDDQPAHLRTYY